MNEWNNRNRIIIPKEKVLQFPVSEIGVLGTWAKVRSPSKVNTSISTAGAPSGAGPTGTEKSCSLVTFTRWHLLTHKYQKMHSKFSLPTPRATLHPSHYNETWDFDVSSWWSSSKHNAHRKWKYFLLTLYEWSVVSAYALQNSFLELG